MPSSIFNQLDLKVLDFACGIYHVERAASDETAIAILNAPFPLDQADVVKLFLIAVPRDIEPARMLRHYANLNIHRLEESGLTPISMSSAQALGGCEEQLSLLRPLGRAPRHAAMMTSGDVVCYS